MEIVATQPSTYPLNHGAQTLEEFNDVICMLQPASAAAVAVCQRIWSVSPQYILQRSNPALRADGTTEEDDDDLEMIVGEDWPQVGVDPQPRTTKNDHPTDAEQVQKAMPAPMKPIAARDGPVQELRPRNLDIALRTSSPVQDILQGFTFGRDLSKSDIILQTGGSGDQRISGLHFRIYVNHNGVLMLEDKSTNGITVDNEPLGKKYLRSTKSLGHGSTIELVTNANRVTKDIEQAKFIVKLPKRNDAEYTKNLEQYMVRLNRQKAEQQQKHNGALFPKSAHAAAGKVDYRIDRPLNMELIVAGTEQYHLADGWTANGKYRVVSELGKGAFAMVYKVTTNVEGEFRAAKRIDRAAFAKRGAMDFKVVSELEIMQKINHPHIVQFLDHDVTTKHLYIVMEYMPCGDLAPYAVQEGYLGVATLKSITRQLLHALAYIHRNSIVHRDIKPENVLVCSKDPFLVKLSDFGLSKIIKSEVAQTFCGTLLYCAPEIYPDYEQVRARLPRIKRKSSAPKPYSSAVDIWSLGTVMYHLLASKPPFKGSGEDQGYKMLRAVMCDDLNLVPIIARGVPSDGLEFFKSTIDIDADSRLSAMELLDHPWMKDVSDVIPIPKLEESQIIGLPLSEPLKTLKEEDEWDALDSDSFVAEARNLVKTPTPDAPSLTTGETSADDKGQLAEIDSSQASSQIEVDILVDPTTHMPDEMLDESSARWEEESAIGSGQSSQSWFARGWPMRNSKGQAVEASPSGSEDNTLKPPQAGRLFGEISQDPNLESGMFGADAQSQSKASSASPTSPSQIPSSSFGTESRVSNKNTRGHKVTRSILRSAVTNSMLNGKRYRSTTASGSDESNTSSFDEPAAKRSMVRISEPDSAESSTATDHKPSLEVNQSLSQKVDNLYVDGRLATLTPLPDCISSTEILIKTRLSSFGRAATNTIVYENQLDSRIPRTAFDIYFFSPGKAHLRHQTWYKEPNLRAVVMTRSRAGIKVNGTRVPDSSGASTFKVVVLHTGDTIEVYNSGRNKLVYRCDFHVSDSQLARTDNEPVVVEDNNELYEAANSGLVTQVSAAALDTTTTVV